MVRRLAPIAVVLVAVLAACSTIELFASFGQTLRDEGFTNPTVNVEGSSPVTLTISAGSPGGTTSEEAHAQAAELVWTRFPRRVERVAITIDGSTRTYTRADLEQRYGERPAELDEVALEEELNRLASRALLGIAAAGVVLVLGVGVVLILVMRARRRSGRAVPPGPWSPPPPAPGWAAPTPPAGGWGPPAGPTPPPAPGWGPAHHHDDPSHPPPWAPPSAAVPDGADAPPPPAPDPMPTPLPPPGPVAPPAPTPSPAPPAPASRSRAPGVGRRPRGPVPPPEQTPPGWER